MPNLHSASQLAQLDNLGSSIDSFDVEEQLPLVKQICGEFIKRVQTNSKSENLLVSGSIADIQMEDVPNGVNIVAPLHLVFQDMGVNGNKNKFYDTPFSYKDKMPPVQVFRDWAKSKSGLTINNPHFYGDKVDIDEGAAWAIAKTIQRDGIKPKNVYTKEIPKLVDDLAKSIADFSVQQIFKSL